MANNHSVWALVFIVSESRKLQIRFLTTHAQHTMHLHWLLEGRGTGERHPPPKSQKDCCRDLMLFSYALFLATTFPEIVGKIICNWVFFPKIQSFLKVYTTICVFRPNEGNANTVFKEFWKIWENNTFLQFCKDIFFEKNCKKTVEKFQTFVFLVQTRENWTRAF